MLSFLSLSLSLPAQTSNTTQMLLYELARNADAQVSARQEIASLVQPGQQPEARHVKRMTYLKACIKETLRSGVDCNLNMLLLLPSRNILSVRAPDSWSKGCKFESR